MNSIDSLEQFPRLTLGAKSFSADKVFKVVVPSSADKEVFDIPFVLAVDLHVPRF